jgi:predicted ATP-dependent endonuclease of OLD family
MKLVAFNIQNYRSIVHSGWCSLAHDNITALIGQNESGKTSVLEALQSFYDGLIYEDVLRSDLSLPVVSCTFEMEKGKVSDLLETNRLVPDISDILNDQKEFTLTRKWKSDKSSALYLSTDSILDYFESKELEQAEIEQKTQEEINSLLEIANETIRSMEIAESLKIDAQKKLTESRKQLDASGKALRKAKKPDVRLIAEKELELAQHDYAGAEEDFKEKIEAFEKSKLKTQELSEKVSVCKACNQAIQQVTKLQADILRLRNEVRELEHQFEISTSERDQKMAYAKLQQVNAELSSANSLTEQYSGNEKFQKLVATKVLKGIRYKIAEAESLHELSQTRELYTIYDLGEILFKHIPTFEFFEDFSSLLPNKIDLEDILNENNQVEGYKAARNFLEIAGLNAGFFREKNHRILKQKIENLNGEITINFQDYWSQNVGKDSKICLNFELEHYDYTHPEKSGKPYLEFWIKDKSERLYPKQRSRGVRWFLSFYLELKATAKSKNELRVLLIDEPGLSLHARAQEDVLKVFEDLKDKMQIVYCTHSPHLVNVNKLYRILAVQRAVEDDDRSETIVLNGHSLYQASSDTLSPVYSLMGVKVNNQDFIKPANNIIVEDTLAYYYLNAFCQFGGLNPLPSLIPSTGLTNIPVLTNILLGWKVGFSILLMGGYRSNNMQEELTKSLFYLNKDETDKKIIRLEEFEYPEDIFSTLDFKKFVLHKREGITEKNSEYILENNISRTILASQFINYCESKKIKLNDFDDETQKNIKLLIDKIFASVT